MTLNMDCEYHEMLKVLVGLRLNPIGAAADMLWVHFGALRVVVGRKGNTKKVGDWALHLQCPWRIVRSGALMLASSDFYYEADTGEHFDPESNSESVFQRHAKQLNTLLDAEKPVVTTVHCTEAGAFDLTFDREIKLSVMPVESGRVLCSESWRLFEPSRDSPHFVFPKIGEMPNRT
ncbi:MAG: hypothetical protein HZA31_11475 [Opitutae bacterium]|nr:hypothetical protein [Opitutae bacterium]